MHQQAYEVGAFAQYLRDLVARLVPGRGWYGVFARRDPVGLRSCLDGVEIPPWDVVESLLADLAALHGARFAEQVSVRAAALYSASAAAHDRRPGGRQELVHRLELMVREQHRAAERLRGAGAGGPDPAEPEALAWARDDHQRATARCAELRGRLAAVAVPEGWFREEGSDERGRGPSPLPGRSPGPSSRPQWVPGRPSRPPGRPPGLPGPSGPPAACRGSGRGGRASASRSGRERRRIPGLRPGPRPPAQEAAGRPVRRSGGRRGGGRLRAFAAARSARALALGPARRPLRRWGRGGGARGSGRCRAGPCAGGPAGSGRSGRPWPGPSPS
ncbi:hypothetical protein [Streptomyces anulatus]|uniref:hypothetical protein n=1 Tax=Streptomyces anulatus TaxID=1892 RepID=UPI0032E7F779